MQPLGFRWYNYPMNKNKIVFGSLLGLLFLATFFGWHSLNVIFYSQGDLVFAVAGFLLAVFLVSLIWILAAPQKYIRFAASAIFIFPAFLFFEINVAGMLIALASFLILCWSAKRAAREVEERIGINIIRILSRSLPLIFTAIILLSSCFFYYSQFAFDLMEGPLVPRPIFDFVVSYLDDMIGDNIELPLDLGIMENLGLPFGESFSEMTEMLDVQLPEKINIETPVDLRDEKLRDELYETINQKLNVFLKSDKKISVYFRFSLALSFFFGVKAVSLLVVWILVPLIFLFFKLLVLLKLVKISQRTVYKEFIEF